MSRSARGGRSNFAQFGACAFGLIRSGELPLHFAQVTNGGRFESQLEFGHALLIHGRSQLKTPWIVGNHRVVGHDCVGEVVLRVIDFAQIKLRVRGQIVRWEILDVIGKFLPRQVVLPAGEIAQAILIKSIG